METPDDQQRLYLELRKKKRLAWEKILADAGLKFKTFTELEKSVIDNWKKLNNVTVDIGDGYRAIIVDKEIHLYPAGTGKVVSTEQHIQIHKIK